MLRFAKYGLMGVAVTAVGGFVLLGKAFPSYLRTSANAVRQTVQQTVPIEFELRRTRDLIDKVLPDLRTQVRIIAQEEVAIAGLESEIKRDVARMETEKESLVSLRNQMRAQQVSFNINGAAISREQMSQRIYQRFEQYKQGEITLESKRRLLEKRNEGLAAALNMLDTMRLRKSELELKVEALAAQCRLIEASSIQSGSPINGNRLSEAGQLLGQLETRLAVAERVLAHDLENVEIQWSEPVVSEQQVLSEYDQHFGEPTDATKLTAR